MLKEYFLENHTEDLESILEDPDESKIFSILVDYFILYYHDAQLADKITNQPRDHLSECDASAIEAQEELVKPNQTVKKRVRTRICGVIGSIEQKDIGQLVLITGFVVRSSQPSVVTIAKHLSCKKCKHVTIIKLEWERDKFPDVRECEACKSNTLHPENSLEYQEYADYQEIKIQDKSQNVSSTMSNAIQIILLEDLVDKCTSGDHVTICGFLIRKWGNFVEGQRPLCTTFMMANSLLVRKKITESEHCKNEVTRIFENYWKDYEDKPLEGRNNILASICPQLYGMYNLKLALAVVLAGGVRKVSDSGIKVRGDIHLLLCGDPGTGKSQMLRTAAKLASRSVLTTGVGSTAAGLTAAAIKDSDGWHLEAGALVAASGGVCCIDELTTMSASDMSSIHEAMEQQTISIAKAGMVSTLNSKCSVIAAVNPIGGRFVDGEEVKMRLGAPLLSRFDLILFLKDNHDPVWDEYVTDHILQAAISGGYNNQMGLNGSKDGSMSESMEERMDFDTNLDYTEMNANEDLAVLKTDGLWDVNTLREYFAHVRAFKPKMSEEAEKILCEVYMYHRQRTNRQQERTTVRLMDSLIRLAEAHAKIMFRTEILVMDSIFATELINLTNGIANETSKFPEDPMSAYKEYGAEILNKLNLDDLLELL